MTEVANYVYKKLQPYPEVLEKARCCYDWYLDTTRNMRITKVSLDDLLIGGENAIPCGAYARLTNNITRPSKKLADSSHVKFLQLYKEIGEEIYLPNILSKTPYYKNAAEAIEYCGYYFSAKSKDDLTDIARNTIAGFTGKLPPSKKPSISRPTSPVIVRIIADSDKYEIVDGHHRLARAYVNGEKVYPVHILKGKKVSTPIQNLLHDCLWTKGELIKYQPLPYPELDTWHLVRGCKDRMGMMAEYLKGSELDNKSYVDIGCSYGWFVAQMKQNGLNAFGVERDTAAIKIGQLAYGLTPDQVHVEEISNYLEGHNQTYDYVSCFSVLHHFVLGKSRISAESFINHLDKITGTALFIDTGQSHEQWFSHSLSEWDDEYIVRWIKEHTSFKNIEKLGTDTDNRGIESGNYARSLFVCTRQ